MKKLAEKRYGPFEILELIPPSSYHLKLPSTWKGIHPVFNEILLTPFKPPLATQSKVAPLQIIQPDDTEQYEVAEILNFKKIQGKLHYLVHWAGYRHEENTWEPLSNLADAQDVYQDPV